MSMLKDVDLLDGADEELAAAGSPQERNWRGVVIALIVIFIMCSIIATAILILTPLTVNANKPHLRITLNDAVGFNFVIPIESIEWLDSHCVVIKQSDVFEMIDLSQRPLKNATKKILDAEALYRYGKASSVSVSPDGKYIVVAYSATKKCPKTSYRIFDRKTSTFENTGPTKSGNENINFLTWNPVDSDLAYVYNSNVYYQKSALAKKSIQITKNGEVDIINGVTNWLYEEEIFQTEQALWWSKSGENLAFLTIDDRKVTHVDIPIYAQNQYPHNIRQAYPKTGASNLPIVSLNIWNKLNGETKKLKLTKIESSMLIYLFSASWIRLYNRDILIAVWANRYQNATLISLCTFESGECVSNFLQKYSFDTLRLWAEPEDTKIKYYSNDSYFTLLPHRRSIGNIFTQIARINEDLSDGHENFLAMGNYDVNKIEAFDAKRNLIYFTAAAPNPSQRHLYVTLATSKIGQEQNAICITCNISKNCTFHETFFSPESTREVDGNDNDSRYIYLNCKGLGIPHVVFAKIENGTNFVKLSEYGRNEILESASSTHYLPKVKFDNISLGNGYTAYTKILVPYDVSLKEPYHITKRYPVLVNVYAGPGTQKATEEWLSTIVDLYFTSSEQYIVVFIDGRGTGQRGWRQKQPLYGNFGTVEVDDQIFATRALLKKYPFMDPTRVGIWGWSYGGFVSARVVQRDNNATFKCAASIAPVTNFKYYDVTYTERYMGDASSEAYALTDLSRNVSAFHKTSYLLIHGTADDNVHYQNTAEFIRSLTAENVQFNLMVYTDEMHNLAISRLHVYSMIRNFFRKCFL